MSSESASPVKITIGYRSRFELPRAIRSTCLAELGGVSGRTIASPLSTTQNDLVEHVNREDVNSSGGPASVEAG